jgi:hypothetical protein
MLSIGKKNREDQRFFLENEVVPKYNDTDAITVIAGIATQEERVNSIRSKLGGFVYTWKPSESISAQQNGGNTIDKYFKKCYIYLSKRNGNDDKFCYKNLSVPSLFLVRKILDYVHHMMVALRPRHGGKAAMIRAGLGRHPGFVDNSRYFKR